MLRRGYRRGKSRGGECRGVVIGEGRVEEESVEERL